MTEDATTIRAALARLNEAENSLPELGPDEMIGVSDEILADNWEGSANGGPLHDRAAERESERAMFSAFPDYRRTLDTVVVEPPFAAVRWTFSGTHTEDFPGFLASGNRVTITGMSLFEFEGTRARRSWIHVDLASFFAQMSQSQ